MRIAVLFAQRDGVYAGLDDVEVWDAERDAREYSGPWPVVAHPPCARWSTIAPVNVAQGRFSLGDDGGCFAAALAAVRLYGGILEHPARSFAWRAFGLARPPSDGGWVSHLGDPGWVCHVEQGHYGHPCPKPTWLYAVGVELSAFTWGPSGAQGQISRLWTKNGGGKRVKDRGNYRDKRHVVTGAAASATPPAFRDVLRAAARSALPRSEGRGLTERVEAG